MKNEKKRVVLAEGEVTGHAHVIDAVEVSRDGDKVIFELDTPADVRHEEHGAITIPEGRWVAGRVREFDWAAEEARNVAD